MEKDKERDFWSPKITRIMKITGVFTLLCVLHISAATYAQTTHLSVDVRNGTFYDVVKQIEKQSEYLFFYDSEEVPDGLPVNINETGKVITVILDEIVSKHHLTYTINNRHIFITKASVLQQQGRKITGTVKDENGEPLVGVNVVEKGTTNGIITDENGQFTMIVSKDVILQVSYIGYGTKEISVKNQNEIKITLSEDSQQLDDVIVVAYGTMKKESLTGAVSAVRNKDIVTTKNESVVNMLTGKLPGVRIKQNSQEPGTFDSNIQIRGMGNPLIIIDGVPRDNMAKLDANEIESISVLKDGAAAIYGVRAANGVVLIKTKQGSKGNIKVEYSGSYGWQHLTKYPETLSGWEYMVLTNEHSRNKGGNVIYSDGEIEDYKNGLKQDTKWGRVFMEEVAPQTQHSVSATGGSDKIDYFANFGYLNQDGHLKSGDMNYERFNIRSNVGVKVTKNLKAELLLNAMTDVKNQPNYDSWFLFHGSFMQIPTLPLHANNNPDYLQQLPGAFNPIAMSSKDISGYRRNNSSLFQGSLILTYDVPFVKNLQAKALYNYDYYNYENKHFRKEYTLYDYILDTDRYEGHKAFSPSTLARQFRYKTASLLQFSLNYNKQINEKHNITALLLYEETKSFGDNFNAQREFSIDAVDQIFAGNTLNQQATQSIDNLFQLANKSFVGRLNYDYASKYLAEFSFRYDGSSKFASGSQWGFFPYASVGWRISEENFFKNSNILHWVDNLKIRASYGEMGDDSASSYQYLSGYNYPSGGYVLGGNWVNAVLSKGASNPNITWFTAKTTDIGIDVDLWHGLLGIQADWFQRKRDDLLATRNLVLPGTVGIGLPQENLESDLTKGYEIVLTHYNKINDFTYSVTGNISYSRTEWKYKERAKSGNSYQNWRDNLTNRYNNIWWGYGSNGQFNSMYDLWDSPIQDGKGNSIGRPGDYRYEDWNEDGVIDDNDVKPIANTGYPLLNYGITLTAAYKGFDLNLLFQGATGMNVLYDGALRMPLQWDRSGLTMFMDRWRMENITDDPKDPNTKWIPGYFPSMTTHAESNNYDRTSEFEVQNASYLRLKSVELGYTLPSSILKRLGVSKTRIYLNGYNLLTFTGLKYTDPEHPGGWQYPFSVTYNIGLNLTF